MKTPNLSMIVSVKWLQKQKFYFIFLLAFCFILELANIRIGISQEVPPSPPVETTTKATDTKSKKSVITFENADLRVVLQAMARQAKMSLIIPDDIKGVVTARLVDIPVERAMKTILESKGFSLIELDGVYQVKSKESIAAEPTKTEIFQFAAAAAKEIKPTVEKLLTKAGNVQLDERSNTLVITDVPSNLAKLIPILKTLDTPTPQVLIETKLMEMTRNPRESIGLNWTSLSSYQVKLATPTAALTGTGTDNTASSHLEAGITRSGDAGAIGATTAGRAGGILTPIGFAGYPFAAVVDAPAFGVIFSFLLTDSDTELLGSPKVITADNKEAVIRIAQQEPIPNFTFNQQTASFVISGFEFKDVGNILKVTPHVNKDNFITMDVTPEVSTVAANGRNFALPGGSVTIPLISIRTLTSRVMVKSGNTLALGGLLESNSTRAYTKVPFFGDIPGLGELFRSRDLNKTKRNLLIFITPTVIGADGGTGYEDQYTQLKEPDENDRFPYKKSFTGNAKPKDQFRPHDPQQPVTQFPEEKHHLPISMKIQPQLSNPPQTENGDMNKSEAMEKMATEKKTSSELNPDQLTPRITPSLRE